MCCSPCAMVRDSRSALPIVPDAATAGSAANRLVRRTATLPEPSSLFHLAGGVAASSTPNADAVTVTNRGLDGSVFASSNVMSLFATLISHTPAAGFATAHGAEVGGKAHT